MRVINFIVWLREQVFDAYRELYFSGGISSVYLWDMEGGNFAGCFLIKKGLYIYGCMHGFRV
jgi:hypothetical protein